MTEAPSDESPPLWRRIATSRGVWMILLVLVLGALAYHWIHGVGGPEVVRARYGLRAAIILVPLQALVSLTLFPGEVVAFVNAVIYGFWWGAAFAWLGWFLASLIQYVLVARTRRDLGADPKALMARMPEIIRRYGPHHPVFLICARNMPMGGHIVNTAAGIFEVSLWRFVWTGWIGLAPWSLAISALANGW